MGWGAGLVKSIGYDNSSADNVARLLNIAIDRDSRLNTEEAREYKHTQVELEFGEGFHLRAHP